MKPLRILIPLVALGGVLLGLPTGAEAKRPTRNPQLTLTAEAGWASTALFTVDDVHDALSEWSNIDDTLVLGYYSFFDHFDQRTLSVDRSTGDVYLVVSAHDATDTTSATDASSLQREWYSGIVRVDLSGTSPAYETVYQTSWTYPDDMPPQPLDWDRYAGEQLYAAAVVPSTATSLPSGHLVIARWTGTSDTSLGQDDELEIVLYDPDAEADVDVLYTFDAGYNPFATLDVASDGTIYVMASDVYFDAAREQDDTVWGSILELSPSKTADGNGGYDYAASLTILGSTLLPDNLGVCVGPDGSVYAFDGYNGSGHADVFEIAPLTDQDLTYASISQSTCCLESFEAFCWDSNGTFWVGARDNNRDVDYVNELMAGTVVSSSGAIAKARYRCLRSLAGDGDGGILVLHDDGQLDVDGNVVPKAATVYVLAEDTSDGGDTGDGDTGGGKGNGKGKNK